MLTTADGFEFEVAATQWDNFRSQWHTLVTIHDGDKRFTLAVVTDAAIKAHAVTECVQKSMAQYKYRDTTPARGRSLKGGV